MGSERLAGSNRPLAPPLIAPPPITPPPSRRRSSRHRSSRRPRESRQMGGRVVQPVIAPEQLVVDGDRGHAEHPARVRLVGGAAERRLYLRIADRPLDLLA